MLPSRASTLKPARSTFAVATVNVHISLTAMRIQPPPRHVPRLACRPALVEVPYPQGPIHNGRSRRTTLQSGVFGGRRSGLLERREGETVAPQLLPVELGRLAVARPD